MFELHLILCAEIQGGQIQPRSRGIGYGNAVAQISRGQQRPALCPCTSKKARKNASQNTRPPEPPRSAIVDVFVKGAEEWNGKFREFIKSTTFDPALGGYPPVAESSNSGPRDTTLDTNTVFYNLMQNPLTYDNYSDLHGSDDVTEISGALGGGGDFDGVE
ncbi:hypothetical protein B0H14DRAFT_2590413 [Mycena olivaceomarginata]|nr:hypothetical protein B0H14DRAFT_2590413 [Mycena olivaceomarginata]